MKYYQILLLILVPAVASAAETGGDFWKNCPGPACPANAASIMRPAEKAANDKTTREMIRGLGEYEELDIEREHPTGAAAPMLEPPTGAVAPMLEFQKEATGKRHRETNP